MAAYVQKSRHKDFNTTTVVDSVTVEANTAEPRGITSPVHCCWVGVANASMGQSYLESSDVTQELLMSVLQTNRSRRHFFGVHPVHLLVVLYSAMASKLVIEPCLNGEQTCQSTQEPEHREQVVALYPFFPRGTTTFHRLQSCDTPPTRVLTSGNGRLSRTTSHDRGAKCLTTIVHKDCLVVNTHKTNFQYDHAKPLTNYKPYQ